MTARLPRQIEHEAEPVPLQIVARKIAADISELSKSLDVKSETL